MTQNHFLFAISSLPRGHLPQELLDFSSKSSGVLFFSSQTCCILGSLEKLNYTHFVGPSHTEFDLIGLQCGQDKIYCSNYYVFHAPVLVLLKILYMMEGSLFPKGSETEACTVPSLLL